MRMKMTIMKEQAIDEMGCSIHEKSGILVESEKISDCSTWVVGNT